MQKLKIGILGCANIAQRSILPALLQLESKFILNGIASRDKMKVEECAGKFNTTGYNSYSQLLDEGDLDAVYIPLPNSLHYEWIKKALERGIHVLSEKSLTCSLKDTIEIINTARKNKLAVVENFQFRFHSQLDYILDLLEKGSIGDLRCMRSSFGFPPFIDENNIRYKKELGGGALLDAAAYPIKMSQIILGEDISVKAANLFYDSKYEVDTWGGAFLSENNSSLFSEIAFGFDNYYQCNLELWGSEGKITAERIFTAPPGYKPTITIEKKKNKEILELKDDNHFLNMLNYFYDHIITGDFENEYAQNINQSRLIQEVRETA